MSPEDTQKNEQETGKKVEVLSDEELEVTAEKQGFTEKEATDFDKTALTT